MRANRSFINPDGEPILVVHYDHLSAPGGRRSLLHHRLYLCLPAGEDRIAEVNDFKERLLDMDEWLGESDRPGAGADILSDAHTYIPSGSSIDNFPAKSRHVYRKIHNFV